MHGNTFRLKPEDIPKKISFLAFIRSREILQLYTVFLSMKEVCLSIIDLSVAIFSSPGRDMQFSTGLYSHRDISPAPGDLRNGEILKGKLQKLFMCFILKIKRNI